MEPGPSAGAGKLFIIFFTSYLKYYKSVCPSHGCRNITERREGEGGGMQENPLGVNPFPLTAAFREAMRTVLLLPQRAENAICSDELAQPSLVDR